MPIKRKELHFKEKYKIGDKIQIKHLAELNDEDAYNATQENPGKDCYLGRTMTVCRVDRLMNGQWYCLVEEDDGDFCWFDSFIVQTKPLPALLTKGLPNL